MVTVPSKVQNASHFLHSVTVGSGGNSSASGSNSVFDSITAYGGGRGGGNGGNSGGDGSSGGGAAIYGTPGTGNQGGNGGAGGFFSGGGGGGAGGNGVGAPANYYAGDGGIGITNDITGTSTYYAGGGGGGGVNGAGAGGLGGGGNGATNANRTGSAGTNGLGGGGGGAAGYYPGANYYGGTGGSGVVIIRYPTGTVTASGGTISTTTTDTIHTFTSDDTFTVTSTSCFATSSAPARFVDFTYEYDPVGNITSSTDNATGANNQTTAYTYDALNRLLSASTTGISTFAPYSRTYTYNALGNITSVASPTVTTHTYAGTGYANPHAPTTIGGVVYGYDANGNVTSAGDTLYVWDYANRLTALGMNGATTTFGYDYAGQRVFSQTASSTTVFPSKYFSITSTTNGATTTATSTSYIFGNDQLVAYVEQDTINGTATGTPRTFYVHPDHVGSTNVITDENGDVVLSKDYFPYGATRVESGSASLARGYIGEFEEGGNLSYLNARYYEGSRGQFLSQDPVFWQVGSNKVGRAMLTDPQSMNSYSYAGNNPIINKDPSGLWYKEFITGQQSWSNFYGEVGEAANYLGQSSPAWNFGMNHRVATGMIIVGPFSGIAAASGLSAYSAFHAVGASGVGAAYAAKQAFAGIVYSLLTASSLNTIPSNLTTLSQGGPGSYFSTLGSLGWNSASLIPGYVGATVDAIQFGGLVGQGIVNTIQNFSSSNIQTRSEAVNSFNSQVGASSNESKLWTTPGGTVIDWYGNVYSPAPNSE